MSLKDRLIKNSTLELTSSLDESIVFSKKDMITTPVPMINVALSGSVSGGLLPGLTMIAGPSKHFKTGFALLLASSFLKKYPDGIILFYDSEFGSPESYFTSFGVDPEHVVHSPIRNVEELKFDIVKQLEELKKEDNVLILIDSIGNLASKKEVDDAIDQKSVADMSRAKALKSLFRIITPYLTPKSIPCVVINHTYKEIGMYPRDIVGGGTGSYYSANDIWIVGRQQDKDGTEVTGYNFIINIEKSRLTREKSKIPVTVSFDGGINKWSGLLDLAIEGKYILKSGGWYTAINQETGEEIGGKRRAADLEQDGEFWMNLFKTTNFAKFISDKYRVANSPIMSDESEQ